MKLFSSIVLIVIGITFLGCSDSPSGFFSEKPETEINDDGLGVLNKSENTIYYFAVDQDFAATALWYPKSEKETAIKAKSVKEIPFSEIPGYKSNNEIIFYYWSSKDPGPNQIKNILIENSN